MTSLDFVCFDKQTAPDDITQSKTLKRRWCYETFREQRAVKFVVIVTPEDLEANAEFVRLADQYVLAPGGANHNNYANCEFIAEVARSKQGRIFCSLYRFIWPVKLG